jgi:hypothetical protein
MYHRQMPGPELAPVQPIGSPAFFSDPYRIYRGMLDSGTGTVQLSPHIVAVTHYRDCLDILRDPRLSAKRYTSPLGISATKGRSGSERGRARRTT